LRLAAWLRGTHAESIVLKLRFPRRVVAEVTRLVALHPIDARRLRGDVDVRRLVRRVGEACLAKLFALREAEIAATPASQIESAAAQRAALAALRDRIDRVQRAGVLAIDSATIAATLGCVAPPSAPPSTSSATASSKPRLQRHDPHRKTEEKGTVLP
jgi:hypothetical protein